MSVYDRLRHLKTLLIENDPWIRNAMGIIFENEGCQLTVLDSAEKALSLLSDQQYDIIICDYLLHGINGVDFFRRFIPGDEKTITLLITGYGNIRIVKDALEAGVDDILEKPFTTELLEKSLLKIMDRKYRDHFGLTL